MSGPLVLERRGEPDRTVRVGPISLTPMVEPDYWAYRVVLTEGQAVVGFPKFSTVGIGFAVEEDWNTNLPALTPAEQILAHIGRNKGDDGIDDADVLAAIRLVQAAVREDAEKVEA